MVSSVSVAGVTVSVVDTDTPPSVAVIVVTVAAPVSTPVATPVAEMVATVVSDEVQVTDVVMSCVDPSV